MTCQSRPLLQKSKTEKLQNLIILSRYCQWVLQDSSSQETADVLFWIQHMSWTYCHHSGGLNAQKMLPSFRNRKPLTAMQTCSCEKERYCLPSPDDVPIYLLDLTTQEIQALRPLDVHTGDYEKKQHGYRVRTSPFRVTWSKTSVVEKIHRVWDPASRHCCQLAYQALMNNSGSDYRKFVEMQQSGVRDPWPYEIFTSEHYNRVECALWPNLYYQRTLRKPFTGWGVAS